MTSSWFATKIFYDLIMVCLTIFSLYFCLSYITEANITYFMHENMYPLSFAQPIPYLPTKETFCRVVNEKGDKDKIIGPKEMTVEKHFMENQRTGKKIKISAWADAVASK